MKKILFYSIDSEYVVMFLRSSALILVVVLTFFIYVNIENNLSLIAALGILISALLASYSVILNIDTNIELKKIERSNQIRYVFFHLCLIKSNLISLQNIKPIEKISYINMDYIFNTMENINQLLSEIKSQDIVSIVNNNILNDLHFIIRDIHTNNSELKSLKLNTIKPEVGGRTIAKFSNILKNEQFKIEDPIERLTRILTYLKKGYENDFPSTGGIEECAEYNSKKTTPN